MSPTLLYVSGLAVLASESSGRCVAGTVTLSVGELVGPDLAEATFVTDPASTSACVTIYVAVQVIVVPGARPPEGSAGQVAVVLLSLTVIASCRVTLPALRSGERRVGKACGLA